MTGKINYVVGDATQPQGEGTRFITHVCNNKGGWGSGFVVALSRRSKEPENRYREWHRKGDDKGIVFKLGGVQLTPFTEPDIKVINMIAQDGIRHRADAPPAISYPALRECLDSLGRGCTVWYEATGTLPSIHMPRIGCGLGGGDWATVEEITLESLIDIYDLSVTVYDLDKNEGDNA